MAVSRYNSCVFYNIAVYQYSGFTVSEDFLHGGSWNRSLPWAQSTLEEGSGYGYSMVSHSEMNSGSANISIASNFDATNSVLNNLQDDAGKENGLMKLDWKKCIREFSADFQTSYRSVLFVTATPTNHSKDDTVLYGFVNWLQVGWHSTWVCQSSFYANSSYELYMYDTDGSCNITTLVTNGTWMIAVPFYVDVPTNYSLQEAPFSSTIDDYPYSTDEYGINQTTNAEYGLPDSVKPFPEEGVYQPPIHFIGGLDNVNIDYCLVSEQTQELCKVELSRLLLIIVILANVAKLLCFTWCLRVNKFNPLGEDVKILLVVRY